MRIIILLVTLSLACNVQSLCMQTATQALMQRAAFATTHAPLLRAISSCSKQTGNCIKLLLEELKQTEKHQKLVYTTLKAHESGKNVTQEEWEKLQQFTPTPRNWRKENWGFVLLKAECGTFGNEMQTAYGNNARRYQKGLFELLQAEPAQTDCQSCRHAYGSLRIEEREKQCRDYQQTIITLTHQLKLPGVLSKES